MGKWRVAWKWWSNPSSCGKWQASTTKKFFRMKIWLNYFLFRLQVSAARDVIRFHVGARLHVQRLRRTQAEVQVRAAVQVSPEASRFVTCDAARRWQRHRRHTLLSHKTRAAESQPKFFFLVLKIICYQTCEVFCAKPEWKNPFLRLIPCFLFPA